MRSGAPPSGRARRLIDHDGKKIGKLQDVYFNVDLYR
jgi:sporulation protein YlmC with PRC-barrel domain